MRAADFDPRSRRRLLQTDWLSDLHHCPQIAAVIPVPVQSAHCLTHVVFGEMHELSESIQSRRVFAEVGAVVVAGDILRLGRDRAVGIFPAQQGIQRAQQDAVRHFHICRNPYSGCTMHVVAFPPGEVTLTGLWNSEKQKQLAWGGLS